MYKTIINGCAVSINETRDLFSPAHADRGTLAMLAFAQFLPGQKVLDLGCGCGIAGIYAAMMCGAENVVMCDNDPRAVAAARENARANGFDIKTYESDGLSCVPESGFDYILTNPPYQSDFAVAKHFIEKGFNRLKIGGNMLMVTRRRTWYANKLRAVFGGVKVYEKDGYFIFEAQKRKREYASAGRIKKRSV